MGRARYALWRGKSPVLNPGRGSNTEAARKAAFYISKIIQKNPYGKYSGFPKERDFQRSIPHVRDWALHAGGKISCYGLVLCPMSALPVRILLDYIRDMHCLKKRPSRVPRQPLIHS
jgi:hypothetical protein